VRSSTPTPAKEREDGSPVLARRLNLTELPVETTTKKKINDEETGVDAATKSAEPTASRDQVDLTGAQVQHEGTKEQE
jgi:hypothetical protein